MTRDEWQARMVERTLCNDWTSKLEKNIWSRGPCPDCGSLLIPALLITERRKGALLAEIKCDCGTWNALMLDGYELIPKCDKCGTLPTFRQEKVESDPHLGEHFTRFSCECRYIRMRLN